MPRGMTKRRPLTVTALLDAAMGLFAEQGYGATSIPEICARAGLTKGAFYSNFATKDALFLALLDRSWERRAEWIRRAMPAGGEQAGASEERTRLEVGVLGFRINSHALHRLQVDHQSAIAGRLA